jgi:hypothetical protein
MPAELPYHRLKFGWLIGVALAFSIFAFVGWYSARMTNDFPDFDHDRAVARYATLAKVRETEDKLLNPVDDQGKPTAVWVDQDKGLIQIPIDEAMMHELADLKNQPAAQGCEVPGAAPAPAPPPPAPATTNAAPAVPKPVTSLVATPGKKAKAKSSPLTPNRYKENPAPPAAPNAVAPPAKKESN